MYKVEHVRGTHLSAIELSGVLDAKFDLDERTVEPDGGGRAFGDRRSLAGSPRSLESHRVRVRLVDRAYVKVGILECRVAQTETELEARFDIVLRTDTWFSKDPTQDLKEHSQRQSGGSRC